MRTRQWFILSAALLLTCCARASGNAPASVTVLDSPVVKVGIEVLESRGFEGLIGKRVGLVTNPSGVDRNLRSTIDILNDAPEVNLKKLFAPEHGVRGDIYAGGRVEDGKDPVTGLPVFSLYGATRKPTADMVSGLDIVVYDIQDVGSRSYTFISTLGLVMRTCAEQGIEVMVLDRPNPLGGNKVEGCVVEDGFHSFVSEFKIPYIYGLTVGELATLINEEGLNCGEKGDQKPLKCELSVVPMEGWSRNMLFEDTKLPWVLPSPNIPYPQSAINYPSAGIVGEFQNYLNIGIGYTLPFGVFAAEWIDADNAEQSVYIFARTCGSGQHKDVVVLNFGTGYYEDYRVGVPKAGNYVESFSSDRLEYGGGGAVNEGVLKADPVPCHGQEQSVSIKLAPLSGVVLSYTK